MPTDNGATDLNGAAKRLSGLLEPELVPTESSEPEGQEAQAEEQDVLTEPEAETQETLESDTDEDQPKYKVKVNGEELEVGLEDLTKSYMMESDYRQKTMALSKERDAIEAKASEVDQQLADAKGLIEDGIANLESPEMQELKETDPDAYLKEFDKVQAKVKRFEALKQKRAEEHQARQDKLIQKERELLMTAFPEWQHDPEVMQKDSKELMGALKDVGYSDDELNSMTDHRMFLMAQKILQLNRIQTQDLESKKVKTKPKSVKPGTSTSKEGRENSEVAAMRKRLKQTGNLKDAAKLLTM